MAKLSNDEIIAAIKELSVMELNDLVKAAEEKYGPKNLIEMNRFPQCGILNCQISAIRKMWDL